MPSLMQFNSFLLKNAKETKNVTGNSLKNGKETKIVTGKSLNVTGNSLRNGSRLLKKGSRTTRTWQL